LGETEKREIDVKDKKGKLGSRVEIGVEIGDGFEHSVPVQFEYSSSSGNYL